MKIDAHHDEQKSSGCRDEQKSSGSGSDSDSDSDDGVLSTHSTDSNQAHHKSKHDHKVDKTSYT